MGLNQRDFQNRGTKLKEEKKYVRDMSWHEEGPSPLGGALSFLYSSIHVFFDVVGIFKASSFSLGDICCENSINHNLNKIKYQVD